MTVPASPSTRFRWPLVSLWVATPVPSTAGMPYSRATIELWLNGPPTSVTTAEAIENSEILGSSQDAGGSADPARAGTGAFDDVARLLL